MFKKVNFVVNIRMVLTCANAIGLLPNPEVGM